MLQLPIYITLFFVVTTFVTLVLFVQLFANYKKLIAGLLCTWLLLQGILSYNNVYSTNTNALPPKIVVLGVLPTIITILLTFSTTKGRQFIASVSLHKVMFIHVIRVPVEIVLYILYTYKTIPILMTFEGRNFDILAGITAPIIVYFAFNKSKLTEKSILVWNLICLGLLLNIVINALLAAPTPLQQFAFNQPNIAILHFPFSWLPTFIVPIVLFGHLVAIHRLWNKVW